MKQSGFEKPITINEVIMDMDKKRYLLHAIQREFVWSPEQIIKLFDSLMKKFPIGSFLFWGLEKQEIKKYDLYEFIREYHEKDNKHNPKANISGNDNITVILDGQQRLTSLYIALKGSYTSRLPRKRKDAFPKRKFYMNLFKKSDDPDFIYDFRFLTDDDIKDETRKFKDKNKYYWFEVGKILGFEDLNDVHNFINKEVITKQLDSEATAFVFTTLTSLFEIINKENIINYYLENSQDLDKVLNIFIRVNNGGTKLSYSDLLLSAATAQWKNEDARAEITKFVDNINQIGEGFEFDKDFVLKSCLVLSDIPEIAFKVENFNNKNLDVIEKNWGNIKKAIELAVELVSNFGYEEKTLTSSYVLIPVAYFIMKIGLPSNFVEANKYKQERSSIRKWLVASLIKRVFGGHPDNVLRPIRNIMQKITAMEFPIFQIYEEFKGGEKSLKLS